MGSKDLKVQRIEAYETLLGAAFPQPPLVMGSSLLAPSEGVKAKVTAKGLYVKHLKRDDIGMTSKFILIVI